MMNFNVYCFSKQYPARLAYTITKSQILLFRRTRNRFWGHSHSFKNCKDQLEKKNLKQQPRAEKNLISTLRWVFLFPVEVACIQRPTWKKPHGTEIMGASQRAKHPYSTHRWLSILKCYLPLEKATRVL